MKFKTKLVVSNVAVIVLIIVCAGIFISQTVFRSSINNTIDNLCQIAEESEIMINQTVSGAQSAEQVIGVFRSGADYFAQKIASVYSLNVLLYNTQMDLIGTNLDAAESVNYAVYVSSVLESGKTSYIYTQIAATNYIVLFAPLRAQDTSYGICVLVKSISASDSLLRQMFWLFFYVGLAACIASALIYSATYSRMLRPVTQLVDYLRKANVGDTELEAEIVYFGNDEIRELIDSYEALARRIDDKIDELNAEKEKLSLVVSRLGDAVILFDEKREIILKNKKTGEFFPNMTDIDLISPKLGEGVEKAIDRAESTSQEFAYNERNYVLSVVPIVLGAENEALAVISDVTAIKNLEFEQNKFISSVSHELKTPLTTIIGYIDLLSRRGTSDKLLTEKALSTMKSESQRLLRLVNDLLNINTYNRLDFDFIFTDIDMNELLCEAVNEMNIKAEQENIVVVYNSLALPLIRGDYDRLKQVLLNVIDNALKYSHPEDIIRVTATFSETELEITVRDYGDGIPDSSISKLFNAFYRVDDDRSRNTGGFGLGLSIVKNIIQKHGGDVQIESVQGQGTLVVLRLPVIKPTEEIEEIADSLSEQEGEHEE